ncbi:MAG: hypothetical protein BGO44_04155 [Legionella sp. 39-23]|nr:MAG: hypothetical protein BGO44_04155 [Legionella sp. 39-23]
MSAYNLRKKLIYKIKMHSKETWIALKLQNAFKNPIFKSTKQTLFGMILFKTLRPSISLLN